ncbi:HNH endonuclease signature motif containing protein [Brachybacterium aquaticum]|uniref:HNH endonuclease n=1 Tax=Brachybacterium aquaticum TaxID=1432564 RepID=A0A841ADW9_9MICO|nr:HNH endonuclease signature motif containing protein [Brachybacterium aquaticum]MBB5831460.1 hypothetical protein [Brachybacterium aquaticum]
MGGFDERGKGAGGDEESASADDAAPTPDHPALPAHLEQVREAAVEDGIRLAARYRALAPSYRDLEDEETDEDEAEAELIAVALAVRRTRTVALTLVHDAHRAVTQLPATLARLERGEFPSAWFERILRRTVDLTRAQLAWVDQAVSRWSTDVTTEQFHTRLSTLLTRLLSRKDLPPHLTPEGRRRVEMLPTGDDGVGCLRVIGPVPEILALARRLDEAARAVQAAQRHALAAGEEPPLDPRGTVAETAMQAPLALIQYDLLMAAALDTDGVAVPAPRFRINATIPVLTLLGASDEPGMLEGMIPLPASMARELAGGSDVWYRVLTDPCSGAYLPLPAERYTPSRGMLEHLRLRNATCAVPGCTRPISWASEADHIEEYDHGHPERGGLTEIENLHLLCWQHHRAKTAGHLDPVRLPRTAHLPGRTAWSAGDMVDVVVADDTDLATPVMVEVLQESWQRWLADREARRRAREEHRHPPEPPF